MDRNEAFTNVRLWPIADVRELVLRCVRIFCTFGEASGFFLAMGSLAVLQDQPLCHVSHPDERFQALFGIGQYHEVIDDGIGATLRR